MCSVMAGMNGTSVVYTEPWNEFPGQAEEREYGMTDMQRACSQGVWWEQSGGGSRRRGRG